MPPKHEQKLNITLTNTQILLVPSSNCSHRKPRPLRTFMPILTNKVCLWNLWVCYMHMNTYRFFQPQDTDALAILLGWALNVRSPVFPFLPAFPLMHFTHCPTFIKSSYSSQTLASIKHRSISIHPLPHSSLTPRKSPVKWEVEGGGTYTPC